MLSPMQAHDHQDENTSNGHLMSYMAESVRLTQVELIVS